MNIAHFAQTRHATKAFDKNLKINDKTFDQLRTLLRFSPSSVNSQPWHYVIASTDEGKQKVASATAADYPYNEPKILNASHVVVFCARTSMDQEYLTQVLEQEDRDGRFANAEAKQGQHTGRSFYANLHQFDLKDTQHWMEKQVYLSLGTLLLGAATLEVDACPIEGFDHRIMDEVLGLREKSLTSIVVVALGYRSEDDFNASLPKSRLPAEKIFTDI
ncbi:oxygen-insensitive NAD(P)H-dependent nitroreductase NfsB [Sedimenticola thiotaurini]|uniref:Dihydropteridine reductase n=1 Tax=Sedimenticola thiotaurini TaxID=1543721 RepID=A0A0F7JYB6_9GAMM|nr:oxygen-insensitive NAD(P)H-dependent nitroreductase NfsB [Sedimenticola thiotaurini]AKH19638.1 dihydropteridine reductase [Sedimenticola thiotaurini]